MISDVAVQDSGPTEQPAGAPPVDPVALRALLAEHLAGSGLPGAAVALAAPGGEPVVVVAGTADVRSGAAVTGRSVFSGCSAAKLVTAVAVLRLVEQGRLDLHADVAAHGVVLPRGPRAGDAPVTLADLLAHRAGVVDPDGSFAPLDGPPPSVTDLLAGATSAHPGPVTVTEPPGSGFSYSDAGYAVVEAVLERVTGLDVAAAVHVLVAEPLGLTSLALWDGPDRPDPAGSDGLGAVLDRVRREAVAGHAADGSVPAGGQAHYPGRTGSDLWTTPADLARLIADLVPAWTGRTGSALLGPDAGRTMTTSGEPGVGLGLFLLGDDPADGVLTQGWGVGAQCQGRGYPGGAVVVMVDGDPGAPQHASVVGPLARAAAVLAGWAPPVV